MLVNGSLDTLEEGRSTEGEPRLRLIYIIGQSAADMWQVPSALGTYNEGCGASADSPGSGSKGTFRDAVSLTGAPGPLDGD